MIGVRGQSGDNLRVTAIRVDARDGHEYAFIDELVPNDVTGFAASSQDLLGKMFAVDLPRDKGGRAVQARTNPFKWKMRHTSYVLFGVAAAALGGGGMCEYLVQRHGDWYLRCYAGMGLCIAILCVICWRMYSGCCAKGRTE